MDDLDGVTDGDESLKPKKDSERRKPRTFGDRLARAGSQAGAILAVLALLGPPAVWFLNLLPFALAQDVEAVAARVMALEVATDSIQVDQKSTLELQLMDRIGSVDDRIARLAAGDPDAAELRRQRNELNQRLESVRREIDQLRSRNNGPPQ